MPLQHDRRFMYWGKTAEEQDFGVPFPTTGSFETQRPMEMAQNANGAVVAQALGRSTDALTMGWRAIEPEVWWEMNRWLEQNGMFFYCRYYSYNYGEWRTRLFYAAGTGCTPFMVDKDTGAPALLLDASLAVTDAGW